MLLYEIILSSQEKQLIDSIITEFVKKIDVIYQKLKMLYEDLSFEAVYIHDPDKYMSCLENEINLFFLFLK